MSKRALAALPGLRMRRFDAVVVVLGAEAVLSRMRPRALADGMAAVLGELTRLTDGSVPVFVYDSSRAMLAQYGVHASRAWRLAARQRAVLDRLMASAGARFAELTPSLHRLGLGGAFSPTVFAGWADYIVARLRLTLLETDEWMAPRISKGFRDAGVDERRRQQALHLMGLRNQKPPEMIELLVKRARALFGAAGAALTIIDGDEQWQLATTDPVKAIVPRSEAFCDVTIGADGLTLINDATRDPRVRDRAPAKAPDGTRFYAGVAIHSWDGYRIGALCIYDPAPRTMRDTDLRELQDLAGQVEQELWTDALRGNS